MRRSAVGVSDARIAPPDECDARGSDTRLLRGTWSGVGARNLWLYMGTMLFSQIGTWVQLVALNWIVYARTESAANVGMLTAAATAPTLLLGLHGGVITDRINKRRGLLITQALLAAHILVVAALFLYSTMPPLWLLMSLMAIKGVVIAIDAPLRQAFIPELVPDEQIATAVSLNAMSFNLSMLIGGVLGGLLVGMFGIVACLLIDAGTYVISMIGLLALRTRHIETSVLRSWRNINNDLRDGVRGAYHNAVVRTVFIVLAAVCIAAMNTQALLPGLAGDVVGGDVRVHTLFAGGVAVGSLLGAAASTRARHSEDGLGRSLVGLTVAWLLVFISSAAAITAVGLGATGYFSVYLMAQTVTILHTHTPAGLRGRTMSMYLLLAVGSKPIGSLLVALATSVHPRGGALLAVFGSVFAMIALTQQRNTGELEGAGADQ